MIGLVGSNYHACIESCVPGWLPRKWAGRTVGQQEPVGPPSHSWLTEWALACQRPHLSIPVAASSERCVSSYNWNVSKPAFSSDIHPPKWSFKNHSTAYVQVWKAGGKSPFAKTHRSGCTFFYWHPAGMDEAHPYSLQSWYCFWNFLFFFNLWQHGCNLHLASSLKTQSKVE